MQARRAGCQFAVGLVPIPRARRSAVRWVACCRDVAGARARDAAVFRSVTAGAGTMSGATTVDRPRADHRVALVDRGHDRRPVTRRRSRRGCTPTAAPTVQQGRSRVRAGPAEHGDRAPHTVTTAAPAKGGNLHASPGPSAGGPVTREFVHLHVHTEHSTRDGLSSPARICREAAADGARAVAVTDHGTLAGAWRFDAAARAAGMKPIIGEEVYWAIGSRRDHDSILVPREFDDGADAGGR